VCCPWTGPPRPRQSRRENSESASASRSAWLPLGLSNRDLVDDGDFIPVATSMAMPIPNLTLDFAGVLRTLPLFLTFGVHFQYSIPSDFELMT
jgi:hypothetical protein